MSSPTDALRKELEHPKSQRVLDIQAMLKAGGCPQEELESATLEHLGNIAKLNQEPAPTSRPDKRTEWQEFLQELQHPKSQRVVDIQRDLKTNGCPDETLETETLDRLLYLKKERATAAATKVAEVLQWMRQTTGKPGKLEAAGSIWAYADRWDTMPDTEKTNPTIAQKALEKGFYFAATTWKPGTNQTQDEHTWLGGVDTETFISFVGQRLDNGTEKDIELARVGAVAAKTLMSQNPRRPSRPPTKAPVDDLEPS
jgi:hypothetical protein